MQRGEGRYIFDSGEIVEKCDIEEFLKSGALDIEAYAKSSVSLPANSYRMRPYHR